MQEKIYIAIDLKSFYASVECVDRGLNPLTTNLVVADESRTEKTICLAVSPALKSYGISGRARLFEVITRVAEINNQRKTRLWGDDFFGKSHDSSELTHNPNLELSYIVAMPRMRRYMEVSAAAYKVYLRFIAPEDIHVYSIDEVFIDATEYLSLYHCSAHDLAMNMVRAVLAETGITATAGIGTNLYLAKVAMDIVAKRMQPDSDGVRVAFLDEDGYKHQLWTHRPLTDFWRVGRGYATKLENIGLLTMGDVAAASIAGENEYPNEETLFKLFGINARLLIDHAWGKENATIADIKSYVPKNSSLSNSQVLAKPYQINSAALIVREMTEQLVLDMVKKGLVTNQLTLTIGYDSENAAHYDGELQKDFYGRPVPKHAHGTANLDDYYSSTKIIVNAVMELFSEIISPELTVRRINICCCSIISEKEAQQKRTYTQLNLFTDYEALEVQRKQLMKTITRERKQQKAILTVREKFGKNAIVRGINLQQDATAMQRNMQIGGHKA